MDAGTSKQARAIRAFQNDSAAIKDLPSPAWQSTGDHTMEDTMNRTSDARWVVMYSALMLVLTLSWAYIPA